MMMKALYIMHFKDIAQVVLRKYVFLSAFIRTQEYLKIMY